MARDGSACAGRDEAADGTTVRREPGEATTVRLWRTLRLTGAAVIALWLVGLVVLSTIVFNRDFLAEDFATYNQAWTLIGQGHLNPFDTVYGFSFVKANFELIIWPLALIHVVFPQPVALLWVQDLAVAGSGLVAYLWILEYLEQRRVGSAAAIAVAAVVLLVTIVNPGAYHTLSFDFHMEPMATLALLVAGREFWRGRHRRAWCFVAVVLLCGLFAAVMVVGLGVSALLAGRATRRSGVLLVAVGVAWILFVSVLHANLGSALSNYAYLAGRTTLPAAGGVLLIAKGIAVDPRRAWDNVASRHADLWSLVRPVGVVGLASGWGFGVPAVIMLVDALNSHENFISSSFQNFAVFPFVLLGSVMVLVWVAQHLHRGWIPAVLLGALVTVVALAYGYGASPTTVRKTLAQIPPGAAAALHTTLARTPPDAEVISTIGVMGRFCGRPYCYYFDPGLRRPVQSRTVVFVFATSNVTLTTPARLQRAIAYVRDDLHAEVLVHEDGVIAFLWHPPPGTTHVTFSTK